MGEREQGGQPQKITFHYIKANAFRVVHVDGAVGGVNPRGLLQTALYSERVPIPQQTVQPLTATGTLGEELFSERVARDGLVREVEVELLMDLDTAKSLAEWILKNVELGKTAQAAQTGKGRDA